MRPSEPVVQVLDRLRHVRQSGSGWTALCPSHSDSKPSLTIAEGKAGRVLLNCHKGCTTDDIVTALELKMADLFGEDPSDIKQKKLEATYQYVDRNGELVFEVLRYRHPDGRKDFRQRKPDGAGGWAYTTTGLEKPIYKLPEVMLAISNDNPIWIVEGEKDVLALEALSITATCNPGGAGKWLPNHTETLRGAKVVIVPDQDGPGLRHAQAISDALDGVAGSIQVLGPPEGKDVADALDAGHKPTDFRPFDLEEAIGAHDPYRLLVNSIREVGQAGHLSLEQKIARARATIDKWEKEEVEDNFGRLVKWDSFLAEPVEEYDWIIPGLLERQERVMLVAGEGIGKRLDLLTPIPTTTGWTTMSDVRAGDQLIDRHGNPCAVTWVGPVEPDPDAYRVHFSDGSYLDADAEHQWYTETITERQKRRPGAIRTTDDIRRTISSGRSNGAVNHAIPTTAPIILDEVYLPIPPYTLGAWLGDGTGVHGAITTADQEILDNIEMDGYETRRRQSTKYGYGVLGLQKQLRVHGFIGNKHIPMQYLRASYKQRLALLQGLMDTDGTVGTNGACEFSVVNEQLARDFHELILTMGIKATCRIHPARLYGRDVGVRYRIHFKTDLPVFRLSRKEKRLPRKLRTPRSLYRYITNVESIPAAPMRCISVDSPDNTFLAGKMMIPTHNSFLARQFALMASAGIHPFNMNKIEPLTTLVVDLENPERIIRRTSQSIMRTIKIIKGNLVPKNFPAHLLVKPDGVDLLKAEDRAAIEEVVALTEPDIIFFGPIYKSYIDPGGQTSEAVVTTVAKYLDYIRSTYNCCLWLEHHAPLGQTSTNRVLRPFGSSVWSRWPEFGIALAPVPTDPKQLDIKHYRGQRDVRDWPRALIKGGEFPFTAVY